jgi:hypothetical protein
MADRRSFLKSLAGATAGLSLSKSAFSNNSESDRLGEVLPKRRLGRTGEYVTMLGTVGFLLAGQQNEMHRKLLKLLWKVEYVFLILLKVIQKE